MIIRDKRTVDISEIYNPRLQSSGVSQKEPAAVGAEKTAQGNKDQVELSEEALLLQKAAAKATEADDVRWEKVAQLRQSVERGTYEVPVSDLVQKLFGQDKRS